MKTFQKFFMLSIFMFMFVSVNAMSPMKRKSCEPYHHKTVKATEHKKCKAHKKVKEHKKCEEPKREKMAKYHQNYLSPARINTKGKWDWTLSGSYLYYLPIQKDLEMVQFIPKTPATQHYDEKFLSTDFHSGFKVALGLGSDYDHWGFLAEYTRLHSTDTKKYSLPSWASGMYDYWTFSDFTTTSAWARWKLDMDLVTLDMGRPSYFGKKLILTPYVGLKGGIIDQKLEAKATQADQEQFESFYKSDSWLIGPRAGLKTSWLFTKHFSLFNDLNVDVMYQDFDVKAENFDLSNSEENASNQWKPDYLTTNLNLNLGFAYGSYFNSSKAHLELAVSYDFSYYFNQNMLRRIGTINYGSDTGDLMIQGLNVALRFDF